MPAVRALQVSRPAAAKGKVLLRPRAGVCRKFYKRAETGLRVFPYTAPVFPVGDQSDLTATTPKGAMGCG